MEGEVTTPSVPEIVDLVVERVSNCYQKHDLCCAEAISFVLSQAFASGLSAREVVQMGAGFCHGMGGRRVQLRGLDRLGGHSFLLSGAPWPSGLAEEGISQLHQGAAPPVSRAFWLHLLPCSCQKGGR